MGFDGGRVRRGELIAAGGGILLAIALFLLPWFEIHARAGRPSSAGKPASLDGWQALTTTRWILLVTVGAALAVVILTASQRAPAVPVTASMIACVLGAFSLVILLYRLFDHPGLAARAGLYVGLAGAVAAAYGGYRSLRTEGSTFGDPGSIETVPIGRAEPGAPPRAESTSAGRSGP